MPTITPHTIDRTVTAFCETINAKTAPVYVPVSAAPGAKVGECFFNVRRLIEQYGGSIVYGWTIWIWPKVYIEAEHHAVWKTPDNELIDVTPGVDPEQRILFLENQARSFDFETLRRRGNIRRPIAAGELVRNFLTACAELHDFMQRHAVGKSYTVPAARYGELCSHQRALYLAVLRKHLTPNCPCVCGSGKKVKKCCGLARARLGRQNALRATTFP